MKKERHKAVFWALCLSGFVALLLFFFGLFFGNSGLDGGSGGQLRYFFEEAGKGLETDDAGYFPAVRVEKQDRRESFDLVFINEFTILVGIDRDENKLFSGDFLEIPG